MRKKTPLESHVVTRGISLTPDLNKFVRRRAGEMDLSISQYVRRLIAADREQDTLGCNRCKEVA
jgi:hypothetical protein